MITLTSRRPISPVFPGLSGIIDSLSLRGFAPESARIDPGAARVRLSEVGDYLEHQRRYQLAPPWRFRGRRRGRTDVSQLEPRGIDLYLLVVNC